MLRTIQSAWPGTLITWVIGKTELGLMRGLEGFEFITYDKARPAASWRDIGRQLGGRRFPALLHMHASMRANLVSTLVRAERRIGFDRARARDMQWLFTNERLAPRAEQHVMDGLFAFAEQLGITKRTLHWDIPLTEADRGFAAEACGPAQPIVVISPCSSQRLRNYRNWRIERYAAVARHLQQSYRARVILTGGPTEHERHYAEAIALAVSEPVVNLVGRTTLKQLLAVLERASVLICPDSGPAHMATAVRTPVVGLYATSNPLRTGPYLSQDLVVNRYPEAVMREFGVPVGELRWGQRVRNPAALDLISVEDVLEKTARVLAP